jgi:hypothetical protein
MVVEVEGASLPSALAEVAGSAAALGHCHQHHQRCMLVM